MGRLRMLAPRLRPAGQKLRRFEGEARGARDKTQPGAQWYNTHRWQKLRAKVWLRDLFTCCRCRRVCGGKGELVADHRVPHRGDPRLFWDEGNLQTMCKVCHDSAKQAEDRRTR